MTGNCVKVYYANCCSIYNKIAELKTIAYNEACEVLCLTETHLNSDIEDAEIFIENYTIFRCDRKDRDKGGSIIYVHNNIPCSSITNFECNDSLAILLALPNYHLAIACIYRSVSLTNNENLRMLDQIQDLKSLILEGTEVLMVGDFNLPNVLWDSGSVVSPVGTKNRKLVLQKKFIRTFQDVGLQWQLKDGTVTRRRLYNGVMQESFLDQVLTTDSTIIQGCTVVAPVGKSDHHGIITELRCANIPGYTLGDKICWSKVSEEDIMDMNRSIDWTFRGEMTVENI